MARIELRENIKRGGGQPKHWLQTLYTFAVPPEYFADGHESFGRLRIINEDRVKVDNGFGFHYHQEFEIFSYLVRGELKHQDSMENVEILRRGDIQLTSAGTGIRHSEVCNGSEDVHFVQIWALPWKGRLTPKYYTRHFTDDEKRDKWALLVAPVGSDGALTDREGDGPAPVQSNVALWATLLSPERSISRAMPSSAGERKAYLQVVQTSGFNQAGARGAHVRVKIGSQSVEMKEGDGAFVHASPGEALHMENLGSSVAEVLLFDVDIE
ncbi:pirin domain-containing protein [Gloeopeniophorella convolvens]|nr:pirin domain-containing protein [Gloeopeniophorella convolvens]